MADLERFRVAQENPRAGFATALAELRAGRKTSHWIWYVFPQLAELGRSSMARRFGLADIDEATAYLSIRPGGAPRAAVAAVRAHVAGSRPIPIETLMGSHIDALKLVSCLTLFRHVARTPAGGEPRPAWEVLGADADEILAAAHIQGLPPCAFTEEACRAGTR